MTQQLAKSEPLLTRFGDMFVILSATLLSLASGAWLISHLGLELSSALLSALAIYCSLLLLHLLVRRSFRDPVLEPEGYDDRDDGDHWQMESAGERFETMLTERGAYDDPALPPLGETAHPAEPGQWPEPLPMPPMPHGGEEGYQAPATAHDPFTFRPSRSPHFEEEPAPQARLLGDPPEAPAEPGAADVQPEMNVELIQELIKKLANELNSGPASREGGGEPEAAPDIGADAMIGRSVAALETAARTMRGSDADAAQGSGAGSGATRGAHMRAAAPPQLDPKLARIAEAIAAERIEVLLQPIHALSEKSRPRHYEVSVRLRLADGAGLEQSEFSRVARGSGLMPRLDAARMLRAARVARRLSERGRQGSVLTALAGESLADDAFLDFTALQPGSDGRIGLVLSFTQSDVRTFTPIHAEALGTMAASGFRFALEDVNDLDMDFGRLKAMGFEFVKLDAPVFLEGLPTSSGRIPAPDICRYLAEFGLALIVGRIEDDWLLARILGFGVLLGHGTLFGGPKLVKPEIVADRGTAAA
jgi:cyclic-di-GMP phosphodiesterase TipF (flagellum assembly factor)